MTNGSDHGSAMAHLLGIEDPAPTGAPTRDAAPEATDPGSRAAQVSCLSDLTGWSNEKARSQANALRRMGGAVLRAIVDDAAAHPPIRAAAQWEIDRRAARRAGGPFPPTAVPEDHEPDAASPPNSVVVTRDDEPAPPVRSSLAPSVVVEADRVTDGGASPESPMHLESVRDTLRALRDQLDPQDYERAPRTCRVAVKESGRVVLQPLMPGGQLGEPMPLSRHARSQLGSFVLGAHGVTVLDRIRAMALDGNPAVGAQVATGAWALAAANYDQPLKLRTVRRGNERQIRAVLSQGYQVYDHVDLVEDALESLGSDADNYRVIGHRLDDTMGRIRLIGGDAETMEAWEAKAVDKPFPMISLSNSETGQRSVRAEGGTFTLWCSNGCGTWDGTARFRWNHTGRTADRIRTGLSHALDDIRVRLGGMLEAYDEALQTTIADVNGFIDRYFADQLTSGQRELVVATLETEPTVHRSDSGRPILAGLVDAVTFVAHEVPLLAEQSRLEDLGGAILRRGLDLAENGRIPVFA